MRTKAPRNAGTAFMRMNVISLRKYRAIKVVSWRVNFSTDAIADFEGLLAVNREICMQQMSEKAPPDAPPYCAVVP